MKRPWMPLYVADYLADTMRLSTQQHGAYFLLILNYWKDGGLPNDDQKLALISGLSMKEWAHSREVLASFFAQDWTHKRIDAELAKCAGLSEKSRASAHKRWSKHTEESNVIKLDGGKK